MDAHKSRRFGSVILVHPTSHFLLAAIGFGIFLSAGLFLFFGEYTRHVTVQGVLQPEGGLVKVYAGRVGQLKATNIKEGQFVHKGDILLVLSTEHAGTNGNTIEAQSESLAKVRLDAFQRELASETAISASDEQSSKEALASMRRSNTNLDGQISSQTRRVESAEKTVKRYEELLQSGFMPDTQVQEKRDDLTDQQAKLQALEGQKISLSSEIAKMEREVASGPVRASVTKAQLERSIAGTQGELDAQQNAHDWAVTAPCDGTISGFSANVAQSVDAYTPVLSIVPNTGALQATLYASSRDMGFIKLGQTVRIKYDAFPYQKFGIASGRVISASSAPVLASEMSPSTRLLTSGDKAEAVYEIRVALEKQSVDAYGKPQALRPGMQLGAEVQLEMRRLYEWALEPVISGQQ